MGLSPSSPSSAFLSYHFGLGQEREKVTGLILTVCCVKAVLLYGVWRADMSPVTDGKGERGGISPLLSVKTVLLHEAGMLSGGGGGGGGGLIGLL